jgi:glycine cleavage system aminomethyltransferase T
MIGPVPGAKNYWVAVGAMAGFCQGGAPVILNRISFSSELGYEIYCKLQYLLRVAEAGAELGYRWYGAQELMSMWLEKSWGGWTLDYHPDFTVAELGMDFFINWKKGFRRESGGGGRVRNRAEAKTHRDDHRRRRDRRE